MHAHIGAKILKKICKPTRKAPGADP
jgi:hypothetical protein